jgi:hypothetical protein
MVKNRYPLPRIYDLLDKLNNVVYFTKLYLQREKLYVKFSKCEFGKTALVYLGHIVGGGQ